MSRHTNRGNRFSEAARETKPMEANGLDGTLFLFYEEPRKRGQRPAPRLPNIAWLAQADSVLNKQPKR